MQSHHCAYLDDGDRCRGDEHCQYKLIAYPDLVFCEKDQIIGAQAQEGK
jgi:hypothetical protein